MNLIRTVALNLTDPINSSPRHYNSSAGLTAIPSTLLGSFNQHTMYQFT